jgi:outer membrane protein assembly factor BamD
MKNPMNPKAFKGFFQILSICGFVFIAGILFAACSSSEKEGSRAVEILFNEAEESFKDERYIVAEQKYREITNRFPYSEFATRAALRLGDTYFNQENFAEAAAQYRAFRDLHPEHPKSDYVVFRIGASHHKRLPDNVARDHSVAQDALNAYSLLLEAYENSPYASKAKKRISEIRKKLARKEKYVADWYFGQGRYISALTRYENLWNQYRDVAFEKEALVGMVRSLDAIRADKKWKKKPLPTFRQQPSEVAKLYLERFPQGNYQKEAQRVASATWD